MRVCISGAQATGKSTVIKLLKEQEEYKAWSILTEIVRSLMKQGVKINKGADHVSQCRILEEHYKNTLRHNEFISDRCSVDAFVYATWDYMKGNYSYEEHKVHEQMFKDSLRMYDVFFYIPIEFDIIPDGVRDTDKEYQAEIDRIFNDVFTLYDITPYRLTGTLENRVRQFKGIVTQFKGLVR